MKPKLSQSMQLPQSLQPLQPLHPHKQPKRRLPWFLALNALFLGLAALTFALLNRQWGQDGLEATDAWLRAASPWFLGLRIILLAAVVGLWPQGMAWLARRCQWTGERKAFMLGLRWRLALWLAAVELVLVQNGYAAFVQMLAT